MCGRIGSLSIFRGSVSFGRFLTERGKSGSYQQKKAQRLLKEIGHLSISCDVLSAKALALKYRTDIPVLCAPQCFTAAFVEGRKSLTLSSRC